MPTHESRVCFPLLVVLLTFGLLACQRLAEGASVAAAESEGRDGQRAIVIAHRGASGYLPEHTLPAYTLAYSMGADFIEPDLVMTKDAGLIVLHDIHLEGTTDVEQVFPERKRADGRYYAADFTLEEIRQLSVHERTDEEGRAVYPKRFRVDSKGFTVPTFREVIELVQELNRQSGCDVGLYPETKAPGFHDQEGLPLEERLLEILSEYGYREASSNVIVQSFEPANLIELRDERKTRLRLVQLISEESTSEDPDSEEGEQVDLVTAEGLDRIARYADGIGPSKRLIEDKAGRPVAGGALVRMAHERGLFVHPYTFRADVPQATPFDVEVARFVEQYEVDGLFSDHPDRALAAVGGAARDGLHCR